MSDNAIIVAFLADAEPVALANDRGHQLRAGRPNVHALLRSALEGLGTQCLFAAACGPAALVETVRQTVVIAKQENSCTRLEFLRKQPALVGGKLCSPSLPNSMFGLRSFVTVRGKPQAFVCVCLLL